MTVSVVSFKTVGWLCQIVHHDMYKWVKVLCKVEAEIKNCLKNPSITASKDWNKAFLDSRMQVGGHWLVHFSNVSNYKRYAWKYKTFISIYKRWIMLISVKRHGQLLLKIISLSKPSIKRK